MSGKQPKRNPRPGIDEYGRTPLHYACLKGDDELVQKLVEEKADINLADDNGMTPLHFAAQERRIEIVELLLRAGADPNRYDAHGNGPLFTAVMNSRDTGFEGVRLFLKYGADRHHKNKHGRSSLDMATTIAHGLEKPFEEIPERVLETKT